MRYRRALLSLLVLAGALASSDLALASSSSPARPICLVGKTGEEFSTIQSAINDTTCLTIQMRPAEFPEQVTITRSLTLAGTDFAVGAQHFISTISPPPTMTAPYALVRIVGRKVKVKVKHLLIQGPGPDTGLIGIRAERDTKLTIRDSFFRNIQPDPLSAGTGFVAIHSGEPSTAIAQITTADVSAVRFEGYQNAAIVAEGKGTILTIDSIHVDGITTHPAGTPAPTGIIVRDGAQAGIARSDVVNNRRTGGGGVGIQISSSARSLKVSYNNVDRNDTGILVDGTDRTTLFRNALDDGGDGIVLGATIPVTSAAVQRNLVDGGSGIGIRLESGTKNSIYSNDVGANAGGGVHVGSAAATNTISANRAQNNGSVGFDDDSIGTRTKGTANTYSKNTCVGNNGGGAQSTPAGLCL
jgi:parallel beta-helix repeat protein